MKQQFPGTGQAGGIVGLAEEDHVHIRGDCLQKIRLQPEVPILLQGIPHDFTVNSLQGRRVFRKAGGCHQGFPGLPGQHSPEDQVGSPIAAEDVFRGHSFLLRNGSAQGPAEGIGIPVGLGRSLFDGAAHPVRHPQRAHIGREIQGHGAVLRREPGPVAAMHQCCSFFHSIHPTICTARRSARPRERARTLAAYMVRFARRMSSVSMERRASPMVGFS